jgi:DNA ligase-1
VLLHELVAASAAVAETGSRLAKIGRLATLLEHVSPEEVDVAVAFLSGEPRQGRIGIGPSAIQGAKPEASAASPALQLLEVDDAFDRIVAASGAGSSRHRVGLLRELLTRATRDEQDFLIRLLFGELRQGALEAVLLEAVARAGNASPAAVRRAVMMAGALAPVAHALLVEGVGGLSRFLVQIFRPVQPMLAQPAADIDEALAQLNPDAVALEWKLDGARIQLHKAGDEIRVYSRNLREVTPAVPEVVEAARALPVNEAILDGEVIALRRDGAPYPFQQTMQRFGPIGRRSRFRSRCGGSAASSM